jgi:hypothetical protein
MMILIDRATGQRYQLVKRFARTGQPAKYREARTGRRYNLVKVYI